MNEKRLVGEKAVEYVEDGMVVGLGTGSTVFYTIKKLGKLVSKGLSIKGIPTSIQTERLAKECGIPLTTLKEIDYIDLVIDGADEVSHELNLIKGGGGALLREKIIAGATDTFIVVADSSKLVKDLGVFPLPVEVEKFGYTITEKHIQSLGASTEIRYLNGQPFLTDNGNYLIDCHFTSIPNPQSLEQTLNMIPGVVENGLFVGMAKAIITLNEKKNLIIKVK